MIKEFSTLYAGHIDLERVGMGGPDPNDRRYSNDRLIGAFDTAMELAQLMDELGYNTLWLAEHRFQHEGYECIPNILMLGVHLSHYTRQIKIGCGFNIVPMWHPLRLAEDFATADILTGGRITFGVGRGYHTREVETFGSPMLDADANREMSEEQLEIILKAFNEESFSHQGKYYTIPPPVPYRGYELQEITLLPRPLHRPVDIWQPIVSGSQRSIDFMAKNGIKSILNATAEQFLWQWANDYRAAASKYGRELELGEDLALGFQISLDDTVESAARSVTAYFEEHIKFAGPLGMLRYNADMLKAVSTGAAQAARPTLETGIQTRSWLCGPADDIIAYLKEIEEKYPGVEHIVVSCGMGTPKDMIKEQLTRFAKEVMPAFTGGRGT